MAILWKTGKFVKFLCYLVASFSDNFAISWNFRTIRKRCFYFCIGYIVFILSDLEFRYFFGPDPKRCNWLFWPVHFDSFFSFSAGQYFQDQISPDLNNAGHPCFIYNSQKVLYFQCVDIINYLFGLNLLSTYLFSLSLSKLVF